MSVFDRNGITEYVELIRTAALLLLARVFQ